MLHLAIAGVLRSPGARGRGEGGSKCGQRRHYKPTGEVAMREN